MWRTVIVAKGEKLTLQNRWLHVILMGGKKMRVRCAIDQYVSSFTTAIREQDAEKLKIPELLRTDPFFEDDLDG